MKLKRGIITKYEFIIKKHHKNINKWKLILEVNFNIILNFVQLKPEY